MQQDHATIEGTVKKGFSGLQVFGIVIATVCATVLVLALLFKPWLFPKEFVPVVLNTAEEKVLSAKLEVLDFYGGLAEGNDKAGKSTAAADANFPKKIEDYDSDGNVVPEAYSEKGTSREVYFSEREVNALLANNTDLAKRLAVDLASELISAKLIVNVDPEVPVFGGKTVRVRLGAQVAYRDDHPVIKLKGVSLMGVPIPNAWLGGIKNVDLVQEFGTEDGFWKIFSDGVESIQVEEKRITVTLKE